MYWVFVGAMATLRSARAGWLALLAVALVYVDVLTAALSRPGRSPGLLALASGWPLSAVFRPAADAYGESHTSHPRRLLSLSLSLR